MMKSRRSAGYEPIKGSGRRRRRSQVELEVGARGGGGRRRFSWRIKIFPKLRRLIISPKKLFVRLREGYVKFMVTFGNSRVVSSGFGGSTNQSGAARSAAAAAKEYEEKMIIQIYNSLIAAEGHLAVPRHADSALKTIPEIAAA
ncbi:uncharacterized protein LOC127798474 [Diospyros lotus]|uniref:uncharacterized protein LOC127798474 n=1 Tax=Diospyros lotus TaxID=55363 RepID=UPI00225AF5B0|nr:uncharacterized protein LOC127798474 [Diospyros lotus]